MPTYEKAGVGQFARAIKFGEDLDLVEDDDIELVHGGWQIIHATPARAVEVVPPLFVGGGSSSHRRRFRRTDTEVDDLFAELQEAWKTETAAYPSVRDRIMHPAYQRIVGLGPQVVPLIIEQLQRDVDHWFWALAMIVGHDAAPAARTVDEAAKGWVEWAAENGLTD